MASSLTVNNIDGGYGSVRVLHDLSITVDFGETVVLLGSNGNGKSTLLKCITGLIKPDRGEIILNVDGEKTDLVGKTPEEVVTAGISMVPEGRRLFPALTVEENLYLGAYRKFARKKISENLEFVYEIFPRLKERRNQLAGSMSGGEQQMLAVARALMTNPQLLLMDEPTEGLAPLLVRAVGDIISHLKEEGLSILLVEQNLPFALKMADHVHVMSKGQIVHSSSPQELTEREDIKSRYLGV